MGTKRTQPLPADPAVVIHNASGDLKAGTARIGLKFAVPRGRIPGVKKQKPRLEVSLGPDHCHDLGRPVEHIRIFDRGNRMYFETVTNYETGELIHEDISCLPGHTGHGSDKEYFKELRERKEARVMTSEELEIFKLKVQLEALRVLVRGLYTALANSSPSVAQAFRNSFAALRLEHSKIVLRGVAPEYSDMLTSEYQSALEDLLSFIESGIKA